MILRDLSAPFDIIEYKIIIDHFYEIGICNCSHPFNHSMVGLLELMILEILSWMVSVLILWIIEEFGSLLR